MSVLIMEPANIFVPMLLGHFDAAVEMAIYLMLINVHALVNNKKKNPINSFKVQWHLNMILY